jgi:hypothetical protein
MELPSPTKGSLTRGQEYLLNIIEGARKRTKTPDNFLVTVGVWSHKTPT